MSNVVKSKFVGMLRGLLRRFDEGGAAPVHSPSRTAVPASPRFGQTPHAPLPAAAPASRLPGNPAATPAATAIAANGLQLPMAAITAVLPLDLRAKVTHTPPPGALISIPVDKVLSQLATGSVRVPFGELRAALPGLFLNCATENDARLIVLPLQEIISRINPGLLSRRAANKVEVTEDIAGPFNARTRSVLVALAPAPTIPLPPPGARPSAPAPVQRQPVQQPPNVFMPKAASAAPPPAPTTPTRTEPALGFNHAPRIPTAPAGNPIVAPLAELAEKWPEAIKRELAQAGLMSAQAALPFALVESGLKNGRVTVSWKNLRGMLRPSPAPASAHDGMELQLPLKVLAPLFFARHKAAQTKPAAVSAAEIPDLFFNSKPAEAAASPAPVPPPPAVSAPPVPALQTAPAPAAPVAAPAAEQKTISTPLAALAEKWPEALRREIERHVPAQAGVALPYDQVAAGMKRGRVKFAWRQLRSWIHPAPPATTSDYDNIELELPLQVIAPLFLTQRAPDATPAARLALDKSIPNLFFGFPSAEMEAPVAAPATEPPPAPARPTVKPVDAKLSETNYYVWGDTSDTPRIDASEYKRAKAPATDFASRFSTPKEVVERAMALPGVAGAVIALNDGLMITSQTPPEMNADTVAGFLPQLFDRVAQCTRELRMGALNNLKFTVGNVPWHIFRVSTLYFAAFGRAGEGLPSAQLTSLAAELDRRKQ